MREDLDKEKADDYYKGGGTLFGDPDIKPKHSYSCENHGIIPSSEIEWEGIEPHCPFCKEKLEVIHSKQA